MVPPLELPHHGRVATLSLLQESPEPKGDRFGRSLVTRPRQDRQSTWLEPNLSPDGQRIAYLKYPATSGTSSTFDLTFMNTTSGPATTPHTSGQRLYPLFVTATVFWASELQDCSNCFGGNMPSGKAFAYDSSTGSENEVTLPALLDPLAGASVSDGL